LVLLVTIQLGSLVPGLSTAEIEQAQSSRTTDAIINNPLSLPHKALQYTAQRVHYSAFAIRTASAIIGLVVAASFYYILQSWYSKRIALLGTLVFVTSAWFLHISRHGADVSIYMLLFTAVACGVWMQQSKGSILSVLASAGVCIALLYIPGMIWFVIPAMLWQVTRIGEALEGQNAALLTTCSILALCLLIPLGWSLYQNPDLVRPYFGLPNAFPEPLQIAKNFVSIPYQLFIRSSDDPEMWLGRLPLLSVMTSVMFVVGAYAYLQKRKLDRVVFMGIVLVFGGILASLSGPVNISLLMPFLFLVAVGGIAYMLQLWFDVFPYNPFARITGLLLLVAVVFLTAYSGLHHYFVAWPNTPETKQVYTQKL
jgi:hypothetical protein